MNRLNFTCSQLTDTRKRAMQVFLLLSDAPKRAPFCLAREAFPRLRRVLPGRRLLARRHPPPWGAVATRSHIEPFFKK